MIYVLFMLTGILLFVAWYANGKDFLSATVVNTGISFLLIGVGINSMTFYGITDISVKTAVVVFLSLAFMFLGEVLGSRVRTKHDSLGETLGDTFGPNALELPSIVAIGTFLFCTLMAYFSYKDFMRIAASCGVRGDIIQVFTAMRLLTIRAGVSLAKSSLLSQGCLIAECMTYFCFYYFEYELVFYKKAHLLFTLPIIPLLGIHLLSTNRTYFIQLFVIIAFIIIVMNKNKNNWKAQGDIKLIRRLILLVALLVALFRSTGVLTGKTQDIGFVENIYKYSSDALFCFDTFMNTPSYGSGESFGYYTLGTLFRLVNIIFGSNIPFYNGFAPFLNVGNSSVTDNILTGYYFPILDYGIVGMLIRQALIGFLYAIIVKNVKTRGKKLSFIQIVYLGIFMYPVCMQFIADSFGLLLNIKMLYYFVYLKIISFVFIEKRIKAKNVKGR